MKQGSQRKVLVFDTTSVTDVLHAGIPVGLWSTPVCCPVTMMPSMRLLL